MNPLADTPTKPIVSETFAPSVGVMSTPRARTRSGSGGRPSKGDRHAFHVRVPRHLADKVMDYADANDMAYADVFIEMLERHVDDLAVAPERIGRLDLEVGDRNTA